MASIVDVDGMDVSALRLYLAATELGSVSKAAARMRISQPSATAKLHKLERSLGTRLLERTPAGSVPTESGIRLASACAEVIASATALVDRAESLRAERDVLSIATTRHVADHFLPDWVAGGATAGTDVRVAESDTLSTAQAVRDGDAELGFTEGPDTPLGLRSQVVASELVVAVVGTGHAWFERRQPLRAESLLASRLVLGRRGSGTRDVVEAAFAEHDWSRTGDHVEVDNASAARLAAVNGEGVAFLPRCWVEHQLTTGALHRVPIRDLDVVQPVRVVWRGARPTSRSAERFVDRLVG
ncbi:LysR family transcriptional regulator [Ilumatobacter sp.]|uniref:LysR family transcriptional regulator n=1 Tax=Ilumatobacter sp. TaxID=1967498 RepID=UPI003B52C942